MKPILRFQAFENDWKKDKLNNLGDFTSGGTPLKSNLDYWNGDIPWITTGDIANLKKENIDNFITEKALEESSAKLIENRAILIAMYGQGKTRGMSAILNFNAATNQACAIFQTDFDINFVYYFFQKSYKYIRSLSNDGSQKNLSLTLLKEIQLNYPSKMEQKKIGEFFSKLDRQIELEEQKLEKLEEQKKGYMQKVFSQELRFKDENGNDYDEWKEEKLENIADFQNGKAHENLVSIEGEYVLVNSKFISTDTRIKKHVSQQLTPLNKEDIAIVMSDIPNGKALAKCFLIDENNKYSLNQRIGRIYNILGDSRFLYLILNRNKQLLKYDSGVGQTNLKKSEITDILLNWPIKEEQQKIGDFFRKIDELIEKQSEKIEVLKMRKKGFLQKMFV
ncbi:restriction endonuclease subunit S [Staphylococcus equorum]|uniref:restriction endonuclease subunit S n=1 Tax=Staphylococcus equorum TaxID=246432 RepID=UPI00255425A4|nr:restriction endonuclease subunit S [Staphylococcus equorum]MDK9869931.1 restriction endonuclease subunit S [Staphylococcus equorum]